MSNKMTNDEMDAWIEANTRVVHLTPPSALNASEDDDQPVVKLVPAEDGTLARKVVEPWYDPDVIAPELEHEVDHIVLRDNDDDPGAVARVNLGANDDLTADEEMEMLEHMAVFFQAAGGRLAKLFTPDFVEWVEDKLSGGADPDLYTAWESAVIRTSLKPANDDRHRDA